MAPHADDQSMIRLRTVTLRAAVVAAAAASLAPASALADAGGIPHGSPDTCGVGKAETVDFRADTTRPGVSEISLYPPVAFGCTGSGSLA